MFLKIVSGEGNDDHYKTENVIRMFANIYATEIDKDEISKTTDYIFEIKKHAILRTTEN